MALIMLLCCGCAPREEAGSLFEVNPLALSEEPPAQDICPEQEVKGLEISEDGPPDSSADPAAHVPEVTVTQTAAYVFEGSQGPTLYGAAAYENTGSCPVIITRASFAFTVNGAPVQREFTPIMNIQAVVMPGETSFLTCWHQDGSLSADSKATLAATLSCEEAETRNITVTPSSLYLADNYPRFTTMTGSLESDGECRLNLIYTGFYDNAGQFLGAWHFTKNAPLRPGEPHSFSQHMKDLPIEGLASMVAEIRAYGVGF